MSDTYLDTYTDLYGSSSGGGPVATLATQHVSLTGLVVTYAAATAGGDRFVPSDRTFVRIKNGTGSPFTGKIETQGTGPGGTAIADLAWSAPANGEVSVGVFPAEQIAAAYSFLDPVDGLCGISYDATPTSITVAVISV